nr:hypothetical protein [Parabacteroides goldsteinii]
MHMPFRLFHIVLLLIALQSTGGVWGQEEGLASYYHERFHGRKSSSGRIHDKDEMVILSVLICVSPTLRI